MVIKNLNLEDIGTLVSPSPLPTGSITDAMMANQKANLTDPGLPYHRLEVATLDAASQIELIDDDASYWVEHTLIGGDRRGFEMRVSGGDVIFTAIQDQSTTDIFFSTLGGYIYITHPNLSNVRVYGMTPNSTVALTTLSMGGGRPSNSSECVLYTQLKQQGVADGSITDAMMAAGVIPIMPQQNPPGMARMVSVKTSGIATMNVLSTTGYVATRDWAGDVVVHGAGIPANNILVSMSIPASGAWSRSAPKEIFLWSCSAANATQTGMLTSLSCSNTALTSLNVSGLTALTQLFCSNNTALTSLNASGLTALTSLSCSNNALTSLNVSGLTALTQLFCSNNNALTSLNASGLTALTQLSCNNNALTSLNVSGLTALTSLSCNNNALTSLNVSGLTALTQLSCSNNALTSLRATGVALNYSYFGGSIVSANLLNGAALNQFYTDLAAGVGIISVFGNPGTATDTPTIATAKGYTITGT